MTDTTHTSAATDAVPEVCADPATRVTRSLLGYGVVAGPVYLLGQLPGQPAPLQQLARGHADQRVRVVRSVGDAAGHRVTSEALSASSPGRSGRRGRIIPRLG
jgi:hypothetical protein